MTDGVDVAHEPWTEGADRVDAAVLDTRRAVFPLHGLDPARPAGLIADDSRSSRPGPEREEHDAWTRRSRWPRPPHRSRTTRGTGRPTSSPRTAASCTCARSCPATPTRSWPSTPGSPSAPATCATSARTRTSPARDLERFTVVDHHARVALVCLARRRDHRRGPLRGHDSGPDGTEVEGPAEVAFVVRDDHQGRGLGSILLEHLAAAARERGLRRFEAEVLAENGQMVRVFRDAGYQVSREFAEGVLHLEFDIDPTERSMAVRDAREQRAEARSVHNVLHPRSVAVIGASTDPSKIGHAVLLQPAARQLRRPRLPGQPRGPVGARGARLPRRHRHPGRRRPRRGRRPGGGDHEVMDSCLAKGVKALRRAERRVRRRRAGRRRPPSAGSSSEARAHGMRVVGPNALGVANTRPAGPAQRHAGADDARGRPGRLLQPVRGARASPSSRRRRSAGWACRRSSRPATAPTCRATTCCSTGRPTPPPTSSCSTSRRSATRASSPGWPAGSPARSRSWR